MTDFTKKLKMALVAMNMTQTDLANALGQTKGNVTNKFTIGNFKIKDYEKMINAIGCKMELSIITPTGERI